MELNEGVQIYICGYEKNFWNSSAFMYCAYIMYINTLRLMTWYELQSK